MQVIQHSRKKNFLTRYKANSCRSILCVRTILFGLFALCVLQPAKAGGISVVGQLQGANNELVAGKYIDLRDNSYFNNKNIVITPAARDIIAFRIDEESKLLLTAAFSATVTYNLTYTDKNDVKQTLNNQTLTIKFDPAKNKSYTVRDQFVFDNAYGIKIEVVSCVASPASGGGVDFKKALILSAEIQPNHFYQFNAGASLVSQFNSSTLNGPMATADELMINWTPAVGATEYDLEWSYIDDYAPAEVTTLIAGGNPSEPDLERLVYRNNTSRVTLGELANSYNIPLFYDGKGTLVYRIRPAQLQPNGQRLEALWSKSSFFKFDGHQGNLNWQAATSFAEEGKRKTVLQYFDGSLRNRQTVTKDNSTGTTVVAETIYDYQGRPAIQVLPAPTLNKLITYTPNFNSINNAAYDKDNFDLITPNRDICTSPAPAMNTTSGAAKYYSANNPALADATLLNQEAFHKYIPDAQGYPFTETQYMPDGTGRIAKQSGVGPQYQMGSDHETMYYYGNADQEDLDALFGTEVGDASHYFKNMVRDANGQYSVSYADMHGRTIATALAGALPSGSPLSSLDSKNEKTVTRVLTNKENNQVKGWTLESSKGLVVTKGDINSFNYSFTPSSLVLPGCPPGSQLNYYDCLYDLEITISGDCNNKFNKGQPLTYKTANFTLGSIDATAQPAQGFSWTKDIFLPEGSYTVTKKLTISTDGLNYYRDNVFLKNNLCKTIEDFINEQKTIFAQLNLTCNPTAASCRAKIGTLTEFTAAYYAANGLTSTTASADDNQRIAVAYNDALAECNRLDADPTLNKQNDYQSIYQSMLSDVSPGGQYANIDAVDDYSVFGKLGTTNFYKYGNNGYLYTDALGKTVNVSSLYGTFDPDQAAKPNANNFLLNFDAAWAPTLIQAHPEYCKYKAMRDQIGEVSYIWDDAFMNTNTYEEARLKGYLNPTSNTAFVNLYAPTILPIFNGGTDPLIYRNATYKTAIENYLRVAVGTFSLWSAASIAGFCKSPSDQTCLNNQKQGPLMKQQPAKQIWTMPGFPLELCIWRKSGS